MTRDAQPTPAAVEARPWPGLNGRDGRPALTRAATAPLKVLAVASLGVFMAFVDATIVNTAFPDIGRTFPESTITGLSWVLNAYNIVFAAFLVAAGRIPTCWGAAGSSCSG